MPSTTNILREGKRLLSLIEPTDGEVMIQAGQRLGDSEVIALLVEAIEQLTGPVQATRDAAKVGKLIHVLALAVAQMHRLAAPAGQAGVMVVQLPSLRPANDN